MAQQVIRFDFTNAERTYSRVVQRYIRAVEAEADQFTGVATARLKREVQQGWPVDTGVSRGAWDGPARVGVAHYRISNSAPYAGVIEFGGYPGVGPKTEQVGGQVLAPGIALNEGIYPKQRPAGSVRRGLAKERRRYIGGLRRILRRNWRT